MINYSKDFNEQDCESILEEAEKWYEFTRTSNVYAMARIHVQKLCQALRSARREIDYPGGV